MYIAHPAQEAIEWASGSLGGEVGRRLNAVIDQWILPTPSANPSLLEMFRERDRYPRRQMREWTGEFAGKYITHAVQIYAITRTPSLEAHLRRFIHEFIALQDDDGYLGPWPREYRLGVNGPAPTGGTIWDLWGHYHAILGLLEWYDLMHDDAALACACRIGDLLCNTFLGTGRRVHEVGAYEMNMAPYHGLLLLFARTGVDRYLDMAKEIERDFETPPAGDYIRASLQSQKFHETPLPRWESLHPIQGIAERYFLSGDDAYRRAFSQLWWSMLEGDRHNNGGFSSGEQATGNPYDTGAIETCCTVAWTAMTVDMLRMTGNSIVADELELTLFNSGLGLISPSGRWVTYDTPMEGRRAASAHSIVFQARPAGSELNCCSVNGPRMLGMIGEWATTVGEGGVFVNYYGPCDLSFNLPSGNRCALGQETDYPRDPGVTIRVNPSVDEEFALSLRIPHWSQMTTVTVNGNPVDGVKSGSYLKLTRTWQNGDIIEIQFDFRLHYWAHGSGYEYADWVADWHVFGPTSSDSSAPSDQVQPSLIVHSKRGELNLGALPQSPGSDKITYCVTTVESDSNAILPIRFSSPSRVRITVNGNVAFDGIARGLDGDVSIRRVCAELPLSAGRNSIALGIYDANPRSAFAVTIGRGQPKPMNGIRSSDPLASIYRGPILLAFDHRYNGNDVEHIPTFDATHLAVMKVETDIAFGPWLLLEGFAENGQPIHFCDFASAGMTGNPYRTWFNVRGAKEADFAASSPLRTTR
jgi:hypothetical protein